MRGFEPRGDARGRSVNSDSQTQYSACTFSVALVQCGGVCVEVWLWRRAGGALPLPENPTTTTSAPARRLGAGSVLPVHVSPIRPTNVSDGRVFGVPGRHLARSDARATRSATQGRGRPRDQQRSGREPSPGTARGSNRQSVRIFHITERDPPRYGERCDETDAQRAPVSSTRTSTVSGKSRGYSRDPNTVAKASPNPW
jgi:hypothetical protein